jgi:hypothetical protein
MNSEVQRPIILQKNRPIKTKILDYFEYPKAMRYTDFKNDWIGKIENILMEGELLLYELGF